MSVIAPPDANSPFLDDKGKLTQRSREWGNTVSRLGILEGSGPPEGVVPAFVTQQYMDTAGTAGSILYIKRDADIAGDDTLGWILV